MVYLQKMVIFYSYVKLPEGINFSGNLSNQQLLTLVAKSQVWIFDNHNIFSNVSAIGAANWHFSSGMIILIWFRGTIGVPYQPSLPRFIFPSSSRCAQWKHAHMILLGGACSHFP